MKTLDRGNNETISRGLDAYTNHDGDRVYVALTYTESKEFTTESGAMRWLHRRGIDINGNRIN